MNLERQNILIVEDELITALDIRTRLNRRGYDNIEYVATGEEAIETFRSVYKDFVDFLSQSTKKLIV